MLQYLYTNVTDLQAFCIAITLFLLAYSYIVKEPWVKLPPGPFCFPLVGSLNLTVSDIRIPLMGLTRFYGDVFTVYLGSKRCIVLASYEAIKEAYDKFGLVLSERPAVPYDDQMTKGLGIVISRDDSDVGRCVRSYTHGVLKNLATDNLNTENNIGNELRHLVQAFKARTDTHDDPFDLFRGFSANVLSLTISGRRQDYGDPTLKEFLTTLVNSQMVTGSSGVLSFAAVQQILPELPTKYRAGEEGAARLRAVYMEAIRDRKQKVSSEKTPSNVIDLFLLGKDSAKNMPKEVFSDDQLTAVMKDLYAMGVEPMACTLSFALSHMAINQDAQKRSHAEIDDVIGDGDCLPTCADCAKLPFTRACLLEVQRLSTVMPFGMPHVCGENIRFRKFTIPKGTLMMADLHAAHMRADDWPEPYEFNPSRFLDDAGHVDGHVAAKLIPYSLGRRSCPGHSLSEMTMTLAFATMMHQFQVIVPEDSKYNPDTTGILYPGGATPNPCQLSVKPRRRHGDTQEALSSSG